LRHPARDVSPFRTQASLVQTHSISANTLGFGLSGPNGVHLLGDQGMSPTPPAGGALGRTRGSRTARSISGSRRAWKNDQYPQDDPANGISGFWPGTILLRGGILASRTGMGDLRHRYVAHGRPVLQFRRAVQSREDRNPRSTWAQLGFLRGRCRGHHHDAYGVTAQRHAGGWRGLYFHRPSNRQPPVLATSAARNGLSPGNSATGRR